MRRRIKIGIGALILALAVFFIYLTLALSNDGLDWIRKYGGIEGPRTANLIRSRIVGPGNHPWDNATSISFSFNEVPPGLLAEVKRKGSAIWTGSEDQFYKLPTGQIVLITKKAPQVMVTTPQPGSWIQQQWRALKERLGYKSAHSA
jgi:hypothetical protein